MPISSKELKTRSTFFDKLVEMPPAKVVGEIIVYLRDQLTSQNKPPDKKTPDEKAPPTS